MTDKLQTIWDVLSTIKITTTFRSNNMADNLRWSLDDVLTREHNSRELLIKRAIALSHERDEWTDRAIHFCTKHKEARALLDECADLLREHYSDEDVQGDPPQRVPSPALRMETRIRDYLEVQ